MGYSFHFASLLAGAKRTALQVGWSQARLGSEQKTKLTITRSIFELEARNFACKLILTARSHFRTKKYKSTKKYISTKVLITQSFFELLTSDFAWKFIWTVDPNDKVQKYKKYKNIKVQKYKSTKYKTKKYKKAKKCKKYKKIQKMQKS